MKASFTCTLREGACIEEQEGERQALFMLAASQRRAGGKKGKNDRQGGRPERQCAMILAGISYQSLVPPIRRRVPNMFGLLKAASKPAVFGHPNTSTEM